MPGFDFDYRSPDKIMTWAGIPKDVCIRANGYKNLSIFERYDTG
jgi:hypothetical protein